MIITAWLQYSGRVPMPKFEHHFACSAMKGAWLCYSNMPACNSDLQESCLASVQSWISRNKLKLNPDKTEFLLTGNEQQRGKYLSMFPIELLGVKTYPAKSACSLGVIFDKNLNFRSHISAICSSCIYHIWDLRHIRRHLDLDSAKLLANALESSRLDYCNSLLSRIAETDLTKLQRVLNRLARVVPKSPPFIRSVPLLRSLRWLPVKYRVHFKICLLTYKALNEEQPVYLRSLIATSLPSRSLRSNWAWLCQGYWRYRSLID